MARKQPEALAYFRTSSAANVGGDSDHRQRAAIQGHAKRAGLVIIGEYHDEAVSGADRITERPGFMEMLTRIEGNGVRTIIVENASRFARDLIVQETGYAMLKERGITLIAADDPDAFTADTPTARMVRQILGAVAEFEKANLVAKLKGARDRLSAKRGRRIEGRKPVPAEVLAEAKRLSRRSRITGKRPSFRKIAAGLAERGYLAPSGKVYGAESVKRMVSG
jgi:DNA invertase Pin-like site-specific DNA recombinase